MKTIGVVGCGFVGGATAEGLRHVFDVIGVDKKLERGFYHYWPKGKAGKKLTRDTGRVDGRDVSSMKHLQCEVGDGVIFVAVPTPMLDTGKCDTSIVDGVVKEVNDLYEGHEPATVVIKSTVPPGTTNRLNCECKNIHVCFNPEFLREATAIEDFKNQDRIILGGPHAGTKVLKQMYQQAYPDVPTTKTHATIAEMVKYVTNCFLATKVSFANEVYQICEALEIDYDKVIEYATKDKRLGTSHWAVPGPDGHFGFGLTCFPKDLNALIHRAKELGVDPKIMPAVWEKNLEVRPERDWEKMKGRAVV
jgi:UDPglucose 6-dehydrogenase